MKNRRWIITLDHSIMDDSVLKYTKLLANRLKPNQLDFVHIINGNSFPKYIPEDYFDFRDQVVYDQKLAIEAKVESVFKDSSIPWKCIIEQGSPYQELMNMISNVEVDLVIAGQKKKSKGSGIVSERLSGSLPCDFLLVPEKVNDSFEKILVSTDFSEHATLAMEEALEFRRKDLSSKVIALHTYKLPQGYSKSGKSREEYIRIMDAIAEKNMTDWLTRFNYNIASEVIFQDENSVDEVLADYIVKEKIDLMVIGSKGLTKASMTLLGSTTLKMLRHNLQIPTLIVKKEGENFNLLDAIRAI